MKNLLLIGITALMITACGSSGKKAKLSGAGATFPAPYYNIVFKKYAEKSGDNVTYGAVGSGSGIRSLKDRTVDFGATDVYLSDDELKNMDAAVLHIPTVVGAVVLSYNLPGIKNLKLTSTLISEIYRGKIRNWDDPQIKAINPTLNLPDQTITPIYRSDGSGTTAVFSEYMSKTNNAWKSEIGTNKSLTFSVGVAAKGNPGVAGVISETQGAIGYIGSEYALALNLPSALLQNSSGNFVSPTDHSISVSAEADIPSDTRAVITNSPNPEAYPISTFTWIIIYKEQNYNNRSLEQAAGLVHLLTFIVDNEGQEIASKTHYAPLPANVQNKVRKIIQSITYDGNPFSISKV